MHEPWETPTFTGWGDEATVQRGLTRRAQSREGELTKSDTRKQSDEKALVGKAYQSDMLIKVCLATNPALSTKICCSLF